MANSQRKKVRVYKATKDIVAAQLQSELPGLVGSDFISISVGDDSTYKWRFVLKTVPSTPHPDVDADEHEEFDVSSEFIVDNLIHLMDDTIHPRQLVGIEIPDADPTRIYFTIDNVD